MQVDPQDFIRLTSAAKTIGFVDIEATGLRGDYNSVLVVSIKTPGEKPTSYKIVQPGNDQKVVRDAKYHLEELDCWVTYYGKGFDIPMLNTRLLKWGVEPIEKRPHVDLYYTLKANTNTSRRSQSHLLAWLGIDDPDENVDAKLSKMNVSADVWVRILHDTAKEMKTMVQRCESDVTSLEGLFGRTKHLIRDITK